MQYAKALMAVVATVVSAIVAALTGDSFIGDVEWINIAIAAVTSLAVFAAPNVPGARITKFVIAFLMAVLTLAVNLIADGITLSEWLQLLVVGLGSVGVYAIPNGRTIEPAPPQAA